MHRGPFSFIIACHQHPQPLNGPGTPSEERRLNHFISESVPICITATKTGNFHLRDVDGAFLLGFGRWGVVVVGGRLSLNILIYLYIIDNGFTIMCPVVAVGIGKVATGQQIRAGVGGVNKHSRGVHIALPSKYSRAAAVA